VSGRVEVRSDEESWSPRIAAAKESHDIVVRASAERERGELDGEAQGSELVRDVVACGAVSLRRGRGVPDTLERRDVSAQPFRERGALTGR